MLVSDDLTLAAAVAAAVLQGTGTNDPRSRTGSSKVLKQIRKDAPKIYSTKVHSLYTLLYPWLIGEQGGSAYDGSDMP